MTNMTYHTHIATEALSVDAGPLGLDAIGDRAFTGRAGACMSVDMCTQCGRGTREALRGRLTHASPSVYDLPRIVPNGLREALRGLRLDARADMETAGYLQMGISLLVLPS